MKKFLINLLLLTTLISGSAFAWDKHPAAEFGFDAPLSVVSDHTDSGHEHSADSGYQDDHCSHGAAHLMGIFYRASIKANSHPQTYRIVSGFTFPFHFIPPVLRPPIV